MDSLNILIVEDNTITAMDLKETLEGAGHKITHIARDFESALRAVKTHPPDLALVDVTLENSTADGIETARELLNHHRMPIIYLTANSELQTFQAAKETLPAAYMLKPFRPEELTLQVELAYHYFRFNGAADTSTARHLYLPIDKGYEKIVLNEVLYLKADGAYVRLFRHTNDSKEQSYHISMNLSHLAQYFNTPNFYRLSRSMLINLEYVARLERNHLTMVGDETPISIPIANRKELMKKLKIVRTK